MVLALKNVITAVCKYQTLNIAMSFYNREWDIRIVWLDLWIMSANLHCLVSGIGVRTVILTVLTMCVSV